MTPVDLRYAIDPNSAKALDTDGLRDHFHVGGLFQPGDIKLVYSHYDRMILGSAMPTDQALILDQVENTGTATLLERRELGILNIGEDGSVVVAGETYAIAKGDVLYVGQGSGPVTFVSGKFYLVCTPAHRAIPTRLIRKDDAKRVEMGSKEQANERVIIQFLHPDVQDTCQLTMGYTQFLPGSLWNTMPAHIHDRRMEAYMYFDLDEGSRVFHFMGQPNETRHILMSNEEAVISPPWSIHSGAGTGSYTFCWAMAGDNTDFTDMDFVAMEDLQ